MGRSKKTKTHATEAPKDTQGQSNHIKLKTMFNTLAEHGYEPASKEIAKSKGKGWAIQKKISNMFNISNAKLTGSGHAIVFQREGASDDTVHVPLNLKDCTPAENLSQEQAQNVLKAANIKLSDDEFNALKMG